MKAISYEKYGPPEVLDYSDVEKPIPQASEVLVKILAASLNYGDAVLVKGRPVIARLWSGLLIPKYPVLGTDIAGWVEAVGEGATRFQVGEAVFGDISQCSFGAFAEYACVSENALARVPANISFEQAAAVPQAAVVALQGLRDRGHIREGDKVLVNGASGGVGTFAVQIARALGAEVTGVCSDRNQEMVRSIGADHVIDYTCEDFTESSRRYDLILDIVANRPLPEYMDALNPGGRYVAVAFNPTSMFLGPLFSKEGRSAGFLNQKPNLADLEFIAQLLKAGKVVPLIDRCYPLRDVPEAMRYLGSGKHHGKVVIRVGQNGKGAIEHG